MRSDILNENSQQTGGKKLKVVNLLMLMMQVQLHTTLKEVMVLLDTRS